MQLFFTVFAVVCLEEARREVAVTNNLGVKPMVSSND